MRPNFRIVEGETEVDYESFKRDYLNNQYTAVDIRKKHSISLRRYKELQDKVSGETGIRRRAGKNLFNNPMLYIHETKGGNYRIEKNVGNRGVYCGTYSSKECAMKVRDNLLKHDWDIKKIIEMQDKYGVGSVV